MVIEISNRDVGLLSRAAQTSATTPGPNQSAPEQPSPFGAAPVARAAGGWLLSLSGFRCGRWQRRRPSPAEEITGLAAKRQIRTGTH